MESLTYLKNLKVTPKKMRMLRDLIVKKSPQDALDYLHYSTTKAAQTYYKVLHSAIANATHVLKVRPDMLQFKVLTIEEGRRLKRYNAGSKGMAKPMVRRFSHVKVILVESTKAQKIIKTKDQGIKGSKVGDAYMRPIQDKETKNQEIKAPKKTVKKEPKNVGDAYMRPVQDKDLVRPVQVKKVTKS